ncbi:GumC family protein [Luteibaculum oceani]|uniref:GumC family protein n=1 Tax=Luteibaculum oceani TaxID=1294296 RepID=UPI0014773374|nr:tyrosine-protein kinase [Luteibaculum oceani]
MKYQIIPPQQQRLVLKLLRKNLLFLLLIPAAGAFFGFYKAYRIPNVYKAQSQFLYKGDQSDMLGGKYGGNPYAMYRGFTDGENQKRILKSHDLIGDVIDRLDFQVTYYLVGRIRKTIQYPDARAFKIEVDSIFPEMVGRPIGIEFGEQNINISYTWDREEVIEQFPYNEYIQSKRFIFSITPYGSRSISEFKNWPSKYEVVINSRERLINQFRSKLQVDIDNKTTIITPSISDQSVDRAVDFLDTLAVVYAKFTTRQKREENKRSLEFIESQIASVTESINQSEYEVEGVKNSNSIINLSAEQSRYNEKLVEYQDEVLRLDMELNKLKQLKNYLDEASEKNFMPPSVYIPEQDAFLQEKLSQLYEVIQQRETDLLSATTENPRVKQNEQIFQKIRAELLEYINKSEKALKESRNQIQRMIRRYEGNLKALPQSQREILNIERRIAVNEKLYNYLLEQRATKIIEGASISPEFEILDSARSYGIIGPNRKKMIQDNFLIGLGIVIAIGAIRFFFLDRIESVQELKDNTNKNVIVGIPKFTEMKDFNDPEYLNSDQAFALRKLRTGIQFMASSSNRDQKLLLVTSMYPSEGKTFVSSSLGNLHSLSGKRVVIVDFDLHKPNLHKQFGLDKNIAGLSMVLTGHSSYEESYQEINENLHILTSGPLPPNPSELVIREETIALIEKLKGLYDVVILDTPPVAPVTDAKVLMKIADINMVVMNGKHATRRNLGLVEDLVEEVGSGHTGIVFNAIRTPMLMALYGKYAYKYGYNYGYNYGYAYEYQYRYGKTKK